MVKLKLIYFSKFLLMYSSIYHFSVLRASILKFSADTTSWVEIGLASVSTMYTRILDGNKTWWLRACSPPEKGQHF